MEAVQQLPAYQQQEFMKHLEQMQLKDSLTYVLSLGTKGGSRSLFRFGIKKWMLTYTHVTPILSALFLLICSMYNNLVERCFDGCVSSFRSKTLDKSEISCLVCVRVCCYFIVVFAWRQSKNMSGKVLLRSVWALHHLLPSWRVALRCFSFSGRKLRRAVHQDDTTGRTTICRAPSHAAEKGSRCRGGWKLITK